MKRGNDGKFHGGGPMFPRLHVNDTEKGGPRAPPRNKMAIYEQFTIPSQRFNHSNNPPSTQPTQHQSKKSYTQFSDFIIPIPQANQGKKSNEDEFTVPIFLQSLEKEECGKYAKNLNSEKLSPSHPCNISEQLNSQKTSNISQQQANSQNSKESAAHLLKATSLSLSTNNKDESSKEQPDSSMYCEPRDSCANSTDRLDKINSSASIRASGGLRNERGYQHKSFRSVHRNLERVDNVSEISVVESISGLVVTPDEVVDIIGRKYFWKARKAILNQQRVFVVQVFELHRLVKVQRSIAQAPQILVHDSANPTKTLPRARIMSAYPVEAMPNVHKQRAVEAMPNVHKQREPDKPNQTKENLDTSGIPSFSSVQNSVPPPSYWQLNNGSPALSVSSNQNAKPWCFSQPQGQGQQWLIPVMTPSEGLVYKPYPGPGPPRPGPGPVPGPMPPNFLTPICGIPAPHTQYQMPYHPPNGPHSYFPAYGFTLMNGATQSGSSIEQHPPEYNLGVQHQNSSSNPSHKNRAPDGILHMDMEVQDSTVGPPIRRWQDNSERMDLLPLFPTSPATDYPSSTHRQSKPECPNQVIKAVPHNARSAIESVARIFRSIQEERK